MKHLLHFKTASYIDNIYNISCIVNKFLRKIIYSLKKSPNKKSAEKKMEKLPFYLNSETSELYQ